MSPSRIIFLTLAFYFYLTSVNSQPFDYPTAALDTSWTNAVTANHSVSFTDGSTVRAILLRGAFGPRFAFGFYCNGTCDAYVLAVFIVQTNSGGGIVMPSLGFPQVVWSANRNNPVRINAALQLTPQGDLVLRDADGTVAWSTDTAGKSVAGLNMTESGNLILYGARNSVVWQSFDHPTEALVPGQILVSGKNLTADGGRYAVAMTERGLVASRRSDSGAPVSVYYRNLFRSGTRGASYARFENGSLALYQDSNPSIRIAVPRAASAQYMKLGPDGHLRVFEWGTPWKEVGDIFGPR